MRIRCRRRRALVWGLASHAHPRTLGIAVTAGIAIAAVDARADTPIDPPARTAPAVVAPATGARALPAGADLDGWIVWLGPTGAASWSGASAMTRGWDSTIGAFGALIRVREGDGLAAIGGAVGATTWTSRAGERLWVDGVIGTSIAGHVGGITAGPIVELGDFHRPQLGGAVGLWAFVGVTPYARVGYVDQVGAFAEIGVHLLLPAYRSHRR